jgi:hypothetical protein
VQSLRDVTTSPRARRAWRIVWVLITLGVAALGVAAPGQFTIP